MLWLTYSSKAECKVRQVASIPWICLYTYLTALYNLCRKTSVNVRLSQSHLAASASGIVRFPHFAVLPQMRRNPPGAENAIDVEDEFVYSYYGFNSLWAGAGLPRVTPAPNTASHAGRPQRRLSDRSARHLPPAPRVVFDARAAPRTERCRGRKGGNRFNSAATGCL